MSRSAFRAQRHGTRSAGGADVEERRQRDLGLEDQEWRFEVQGTEVGERLDRFLKRRLRWRSRAGAQEVIEQGAVRVLPEREGSRRSAVRASTRLRAGERVEVRLPTPPAPPAELAWSVVYEDEHLLAVDKPAGLVLYPTRRHLGSGALVTEVHRRYRETGDGMPPSPCHRLDRETSGLVLFARTLAARRGIGRALEERRVEKTYLAVIDGDLEGHGGVIDLPLGPEEGSPVRVRQGVRDDGAPAVTEWRLMARSGERSLLELRPRTGRPHQLRAHLAALGCPILGDKLYRGGDGFFLRWIEGRTEPEELEVLGGERHALHAWRLSFVHPIGGRALCLEAPLPPDLAEAWGRELETCRAGADESG